MSKLPANLIIFVSGRPFFTPDQQIRTGTLPDNPAAQHLHNLFKVLSRPC